MPTKKRKPIDPKKIKFKAIPNITKKWYSDTKWFKLLTKLKSKTKDWISRKITQKQWYQRIVQDRIPIVKNYSVKFIFVALWGILYLFLLRLFEFRLTWLNLGSAIALYLIIEEFKDYFLKFRGKR